MQRDREADTENQNAYRKICEAKTIIIKLEKTGGQKVKIPPKKNIPTKTNYNRGI